MSFFVSLIFIFFYFLFTTNRLQVTLIIINYIHKMYKTVIIDNSLNKHCKYDNV